MVVTALVLAVLYLLVGLSVLEAAAAVYWRRYRLRLAAVDRVVAVALWPLILPCLRKW